MFNSTIIDVVIGVVFVFLAVSLITSAMTEALASALKWRQATLLNGVQALLNDKDFTGLAREVYNHALVSPLGDGLATRKQELQAMPAYIDAHAFGTAFVDILSRGKAPGARMSDTIGAIADPQLRSVLQALYDRSQRMGRDFTAEVGGWFDHSMARLGGWYKRRVQITNFIVALALAAALNADAIHVVSTLWDRPVLAAQIAGTARAHADAAAPAPGDAATLVADLEAQSSLLGWQGLARQGHVFTISWRDWAMMLLGWLITAAATLFGAAFWFDMLKNVVQLQGTGRSPASLLASAAAAPVAAPAADTPDPASARPRPTAELYQLAQ